VQIDFGGGGDVAFFKQGRVGLIRLTRPSVLNSLNFRMTEAITRALTVWVDDRDVAAVLIEGEGRAFCAGGDVVAVWRGLAAGEDVRSFFAAEYRLNSLIGHFPKPCLSFLDGFVMGGGAGLSMHGSHRIVTENTRFAMPEVAIGFFPDVGMGALLASMPGFFGLYLGLTGAQIAQGDCCQLGLATHALSAQDWPLLRQNLIEKGDLRSLDEANQFIDFETSADKRALIARCFSATSVARIVTRLEQFLKSGNRFSDKNCGQNNKIEQSVECPSETKTALEQEQDDFAARILTLLQAHSPTSLKVIHKQMTLARDLTLDECLQLDYRLACHMVSAADFREGVRARLIDKDNKPHWQPPQLADVSTELVDRYFTSLTRELGL